MCKARRAVGIAVVLAVAFGFTSLALAVEVEIEEEPVEEAEPLIEETPADEAEAVDLFTRNFLWSRTHTERHVVIGDGFAYRTTETETRFYRGRHEEPIDDEEFYELVDPGLAEEFRDNEGRRVRLLAGGIGLGLTGMVITIIPVTEYFVIQRGSTTTAYQSRRNQSRRYWQPWHSALLVGGILMYGVGVGMAWRGRLTEVHPIEPHERRELAEEYNLQLLEELDLDREQLPDDDEDRLRVEDLRVAPFVTHSEDAGGTGGGLTFGGRF